MKKSGKPNLREELKKRLAKGPVSLKQVADAFKVSKAYVGQLMKVLVAEGAAVKIGTTRNARFVSARSLKDEGWTGSVHKRLRNRGLEEHIVFDQFNRDVPLSRLLPENVHSILTYAFDEMLNNAIEHSTSDVIDVTLGLDHETVWFEVDDTGIGAFQSVMRKRRLRTPTEAALEILKGKVTTAPHSHSGEGIFFTSKVGNAFRLESAGIVFKTFDRDNDIRLEETRQKKGTKVSFHIDRQSKRHLNDVFERFQTDKEEPAFDTTEIELRLYTTGTVFISRSQARRILSGLEKFKRIVFDFASVVTVGQAFADEIFRVFANSHPNIGLVTKNMSSAVRTMVDRSRSRR